MTAAQAPGARYHDHYTEENCRFDWRVELRTGSVSPHDQPRASPRYPSHRIWRLILGGPEPFESLLLSSWRPQSLNICHSDPTRKTHFPRAVGQKQASQSVGPSRNGGIQRNMRSRTREKRASWLSAGDFMSGLYGVRLLERVPNLKKMSLAPAEIPLFFAEPKHSSWTAGACAQAVGGFRPSSPLESSCETLAMRRRSCLSNFRSGRPISGSSPMTR